MATIEDLKRKIATAQDLQSVVKTMKALAAVSIRQYEKAAISLAEYDRTLEMGLQILLKKHPEILLAQKSAVTNRLGVVVFGSDWGMCGQFNERIASFTGEKLDNLAIIFTNRMVLAVGAMGSDRLEAAGQKAKLIFLYPVPLQEYSVSRISEIH